MQKVEGSSPFIRSSEALRKQGFLAFGARDPRDHEESGAPAVAGAPTEPREIPRDKVCAAGEPDILCQERPSLQPRREGSQGRRYDAEAPGAVAEWLGRGLQSPVQRFESAPRLCPDGLQAL